MTRRRHGTHKDETVVKKTCIEKQTSLLDDPFIGISLLIVIAFISYLNTINVPFIFDDYPYLAENPAIRSFHYFFKPDKIFSLPIDSDVKNNFILRPVSYFTFAVNFALHDYDVRGYHVVNLLIHIGNAICVFLLVSITLRISDLDTPEHDHIYPLSRKRMFPLVCALIFVAHPLQTQAVTYTIQRFATLSALFFLITLVSYILSRRAETVIMRRAWYILCLFAALLAMNTKENAFVLPVMIVIYEFIFLKGRVAKRVIGLIPVVATMAVIPYKILHLSSLSKNNMQTDIVNAINTANFTGTSSWEYLITQLGVIVSYISLLLLPARQNLLYDLPLQKTFFSIKVLMPLVLLLLIILTGIWALRRSLRHKSAFSSSLKIVSFGIFWFFVTLAVESSVIPLDDLMFEHRVYLPSIGFILALISGIDIIMMKLTKLSLFSSKISAAGLFLLIGCSVVATVTRNSLWGNEITLWSDVVEKSPKSSRAHNALGVALTRQGEVRLGNILTSEAEKMLSDSAFQENVRLRGKDAQLESAIWEFRLAILHNPNNEKAHINLGIALIDRGKFDEAIAALHQAASLKVKHYPSLPYLHIGRAYEAKGDYGKAKEALNRAIEVDPMNSLAVEHLDNIYVKERS